MIRVNINRSLSKNDSEHHNAKESQNSHLTKRAAFRFIVSFGFWVLVKSRIRCKILSSLRAGLLQSASLQVLPRPTKHASDAGALRVKQFSTPFQFSGWTASLFPPSAGNANR